MKKSSRISVVAVSAITAATLVVGCGSGGSASNSGGNSSGTSSGGKTSLTLWNVDSGAAEKVDKKLVAQYNSENPKAKITAQFFQSNPYLQKLQIAMGAHNAATIFGNWGGGRLENYITPGDVVDLTPYLNADPSWKNKFLPSVMKSVTFNGKVYGIPYGNMQPVNFFYNKKLFKKYNLTPPTTWKELLSDVQVFKSHGVIPISLGGKDNWPDLMYFEYIVDRLGGQQPYKNVAAGKANAWSNPTITKALQMMLNLKKAGAFEPGLSSVGSNDGSDSALLYGGKAAMWLMGSWGYGAIEANDKSFISQLGWFPFPAISGGKGNPKDVAGNPSNYYSIPTSASKSQVKAAVNFLKNYNLNSQNVKNYLNIGYVPGIKGIKSKLQQSKSSSYETFYYNLASNAPYFQQSWDTALSAAEGNQLDSDLGKLMVGQMTISKFESDMNTQLKKASK
ncbi:ABC transporter substrate-binding protein [Alicyclobacillus sp. SO9]|uniref:ABC transporter substrate-binding protein n=1 Tax=Alicyclobacillus sp. SO9 TaxID=2665646 RepID=UPI001E30AD5B|nr:extracellular solute-binding protein [Alicyclobacillus sp. SO9]